jgi:hypothetical protein
LTFCRLDEGDIALFFARLELNEFVRESEKRLGPFMAGRTFGLTLMTGMNCSFLVGRAPRQLTIMRSIARNAPTETVISPTIGVAIQRHTR